MIQSKLRMIGLFALVLITSGCATTSSQNGNANWSTCSLAGGMLWGLGGAAQSAATAGIGLAAGALVGGAGCAMAGDSDKSDSNDSSHHMAKSTATDQTKIMFNFDSYHLGSNDKKALDKVADMAGPNTEIRIAGHTCNIGASTYNQSLSVKRANAVRDYLVSKGVMSGSIKVEGKGESTPVASNSTREGRAQNRRAEVEVLRTKPAKHHREKLEQFRGAALDPYLIHRH